MVSPLTFEQAIALIEDRLAPKCLSKIQRLIFRGSWQGLSYQEIAQIEGYDSGYIKDEGGKLWKQISVVCDLKVSKANIRGMLQYLTQQQIAPDSNISIRPSLQGSNLWGRAHELKALTKYLEQDSCSVIMILGFGGIGKTTLAHALFEQVPADFNPIWRSLQNAPSLQALLQDIGESLPAPTRTSHSEDIDRLIETTFNRLAQHRRLLVLDNLESILQSGEVSGQYRVGYENYDQFFEQWVTVDHQSQLLLTSRESPKRLREESSVQTIDLQGLSRQAVDQLLQAQQISSSSPEDTDQLVTYYGGNPLALKLAAHTIQSLYLGDLTQFLSYKTFAFGSIWDIIQQQFDRLSAQEQAIMAWLCLYRESTAQDTLTNALNPHISARALMEALLSLKERSLIEAHPQGYSQQPVIMEFMTQWLIKKFSQEITTGKFVWFHTHALLTLESQDYILEAQKVILLDPLIQQLQQEFYPLQALQTHLYSLLSSLSSQPSYAAGNLFNLLRRLNFDFTNIDLSHRCLWQADLRHLKLPGVNLAHSDLTKVQLPETFQSIFAVAINPKGDCLALGETTGLIQIWSLPDCTHLYTLDSPTTSPIWALHFHPTQPILACSSSDSTLRIYDVELGQLLTTLSGHTSMVLDVQFCSLPQDQNRLLSAGEEGQVRAWDWRSQDSTILQEREETAANVLALSPEGRRCAVGYTDGTIKIIEIKTKQVLQSISGSPKTDAPVVFLTKDNNHLAFGNVDGTISIWDLDSDSLLTIYKGHQAPILQLKSGLNGQYLVSSSADQTLRIWSVASGQCLRVLQGHRSRIQSIDINVAQDLIVSSSEDSTVKLWTLSSGKLQKTIYGFNRRIWSVAFHPTENILITGAEDHALREWSLKTGKLQLESQNFSQRVQSLCFSPNGHYQASATMNYEILIESLQTKKTNEIRVPQNHMCWAIAFSSNSKFLGSCGDGLGVLLWDVETGQFIQSFEGHQGYTLGLGFSPDNRYLFTGSTDSQVKQWDLETGICVKTFEAAESWVWAIAVSPVSSYVAAGCATGQVVLWNYAQSKPQAIILPEQTQLVLALAFSTDAELLASSGTDGIIRLWDVKSATLFREISAHQSPIASLAFHGNGKYLASGSHDGAVKIWSTETWNCLQTLTPPLLFAGMNITGVNGLTLGQKQTLQSLGAASGAI